MHPQTHAAGELRWYKREARLVHGIEPRRRRLLVRTVLTVRAAIQRRDLGEADRIVGMSRRFAQHLISDYGIPRERIGIVVNPIDLERFSPDARPATRNGDPVKLLFASRIAVRKGVDLVVDLSHRLDDLHGQVEIVVIGGPSTWSDYRKLLDKLNPRIASYPGSLAPEELALLYREAIAVLQPSQYEPFALTVGESLAGGTPVIASDEVGAVEGVDPRVCRVFPRGDQDASSASCARRSPRPRPPTTASFRRSRAPRPSGCSRRRRSRRRCSNSSSSPASRPERPSTFKPPATPGRSTSGRAPAR